MVYLFEDNEESALSKLFLNRHGEKERGSIKFVGGQGNFDFYILHALSKGEHIVVFIDVVFDNVYTVQKYIRLVNTYKDKPVAVVPIVCMEYYVIQSIKNMSYLQVNSSCLKSCIDMDPYYKQLPEIRNRDTVASFEIFCKVVLEHSFKSCLRQDKKLSKDVSDKRCYYLKDCKDCLDTGCPYNYELWCKSESLITQLSIFPEFNSYDSVSREDLMTYISSYLSLQLSKMKEGSQEWYTLKGIIKTNLVGEGWMWSQPSHSISWEE